MARCHVNLEGNCGSEAIAVNEVQAGIAVKQRSIENTMIKIEPESVTPYKFNNTEREVTMFTVLNWEVLIVECMKGYAEWYAKERR